MDFGSGIKKIFTSGSLLASATIPALGSETTTPTNPVDNTPAASCNIKLDEIDFSKFLEGKEPLFDNKFTRAAEDFLAFGNNNPILTEAIPLGVALGRIIDDPTLVVVPIEIGHDFDSSKFSGRAKFNASLNGLGEINAHGSGNLTYRNGSSLLEVFTELVYDPTRLESRNTFQLEDPERSIRFSGVMNYDSAFGVSREINLIKQLPNSKMQLHIFAPNSEETFANFNWASEKRSFLARINSQQNFADPNNFIEWDAEAHYTKILGKREEFLLSVEAFANSAEGFTDFAFEIAKRLEYQGPDPYVRFNYNLATGYGEFSTGVNIPVSFSSRGEKLELGEVKFAVGAELAEDPSKFRVKASPNINIQYVPPWGKR